MSWTPISGTVPQYQQSTGDLASAYYLKFYESGTATAFNMATDSTGGTTLDKCQLDSSGYPTTDGSTRFIPHVNQKYKIVLYKNATDADNNTTGNADWVIDAIPQTQTGDTDAWVLYGATPTQATSTTFTVAGDQTSTFTAGTRLKFDDSSTLYGIVTASAYTTLTTVTVTLDSGSLSGSLSAVYTGLSTTVGKEISAATVSSLNQSLATAVIYDLERLLADIGISVKVGGAKLDNANDDTSAINAVLAAFGGVKIFFPPGTAKTSDELLIPFATGSSTKLVGANRNASKISLQGASNKAALRLSASNCTISDLGIAGDSGETGNTAIRIAPEDETQTGTRVGQSYNIIRDIDISGTFDEGITLKTGPDVGGPDSDCYHNEIYKIKFIDDINVGVRILDSNEAAGSASNRNWVFKCYFSGSMNVGVWNEGADTTWISDNSFEGVDNGTSPKTTPTAIVVENTAPTTGSSNLGVVLFNNRFENCTRHIENNNIRTQIIGGNHDRTKCYFADEGGADPLINIGGYDYSLNTAKMPGYKFQTNSQESIPNSSPVFDNGIFLLSTETRMKYYREGTFTPFIADNSASDSEGQTYTTQVGRYTLIGNRCFFDIRLAISSLGTLTTTEGAQIGGLPFTAKNVAGYQASIDCGNASSLSITANQSVSGYIAGNTTLIVMRNWDAATGVSALLLSEVTATGQLTLSGSYEIDSV